MKTVSVLNPQRLTKTLCLLVLAFIPLNMLVTPVFDFFTVTGRGVNWTVTLSAYVLVLATMPFLAVALFSLRSAKEKLFLWCMIGFFLYAFAFTLYMGSDHVYPVFGLLSSLGATLVGVSFYVSVRDNILSANAVFSVLALSSFLLLLPMVLVQVDIERFAGLSDLYGAMTILYGYENPRAVGWVSTICLSLLTAHLTTQPQASRLQPLFLVLVVICTMALFWSGSRGGLFAFTISMFIVLSLSGTKNYRGILAVLCCGAIGGALSVLFYEPNYAYGMFARFSQNLGQDDLGAITTGRIGLWHTAFSYILERPLTGYGYVPHNDLEDFNHRSAHNIILDVWLWFGMIIGTVTIMVGVVFWARAVAFFRRANDPYVAALFSVITTLLVYSMVSGPYVRTFPLLLFAIVSGAFLGLRAAKKH